MKTEIFAELKGSRKAQPVFEGVHIQAELRETLAITTITQSYRNSGSKNIEVVYTFPLPLDAVLLEMVVTLGDKTLKGTVLPKQEAEEKYEEAITDGDAPVMLQNPQPGVYTMNIGNLLPGEQAKIMIRYAMFLRWQGNMLRYHLPTTIAPRYGIAEQAGLLPHQEPDSSMLVDNLFSFSMKIVGTLAGMAIESPSNEIAVERDAEGKESIVRLIGKSAFMDRDLNITIRRIASQTATASATCDGEEYLLWGSFQPQFGLSNDTSPRSVKIVVDCSGSMGGDSIAQAREALLRVLDELKPQDWFNVVAFGDKATPLFNTQSKADKQSISYARGFLKKIDADMGGTEIGSALEMAVRLRCPEKIQQDVLLITDGEIYEWEKVVAEMEKSRHRFFTVGVGSAVSEAFVRTLAERTGGACELVSPNENMAERIHRHFKRIGTPCSSSNKIIWPQVPLRAFPEELPSIYDGDTCNLFAWFSEPPAGEIQLQVVIPDGSKRLLSVPTPPLLLEQGQDTVIARMAAALKLREITDEYTGQELAVKYQLVSRWSNYLAIVIRDEEHKANTLPELEKVPQMLAAGWGGMGSVKFCLSRGGVDLMQQPVFSRSRTTDIPKFLRKSCSEATVLENRINYSCAPAPAAAPHQHDSWLWKEDHHEALKRFVVLLDITLSTGTMPTTINIPLLPAGIATVLALLIDEGIDEIIVVTTFLHHLAASAAGSQLSRQALRVISKAYKELKIDQRIAETILNRLRIELGEADDYNELDTRSLLRNENTIRANL